MWLPAALLCTKIAVKPDNSSRPRPRQLWQLNLSAFFASFETQKLVLLRRPRLVSSESWEPWPFKLSEPQRANACTHVIRSRKQKHFLVLRLPTLLELFQGTAAASNWVLTSAPGMHTVRLLGYNVLEWLRARSSSTRRQEAGCLRQIVDDSKTSPVLQRPTQV